MRAPALAILAIILFAAPIQAQNAHDFTFTAIDGEPLPLSRFRGKPVLVVNTGSFCGFTHQYADLQDIWRRYRDRGFVLLGVPSNDFGSQEPGTSAEIKSFCEVNFDIVFPLTEKVAVRGGGAHPFYRWAARALGPEAAPRWNFHKYLIGPDGRLAGWFPTATKPSAPEVTQAIEALIATAAPGN
jgi:glutathione peroxidase